MVPDITAVGAAQLLQSQTSIRNVSVPPAGWRLFRERLILISACVQACDKLVLTENG